MCKKEEKQNKFFKYFSKSDGKEIEMGDDIKLTHKEKTPFGDAEITIIMTIDDKNIEELVKHGFIEKKRIQDCITIPSDMQFYIDELSRRLKWNKEMTAYAIAGFEKARPSIAFQLLLKEVALWMEKNLDQKPLAENETIFIFDIPNGEIHEISTNGIKKFSTFAGFSSYENALKAKEILKNIYNKIYG